MKLTAFKMAVESDVVAVVEVAADVPSRWRKSGGRIAAKLSVRLWSCLACSLLTEASSDEAELLR